MWEGNKRPSQFTTIDECIKLALIDIGEEGASLYNRFKVWCINGYEELGYDVLNRYKQKYLPVDTTNKTAKLPDDFVQWLRVGTINQGNEINDLTFDGNLVFHPIEEEGCDPVPHCSCGCTDPLCAAISNATTTEETITINGTDYTKTTTVCTNDSGTITARICEPLVTNPAPYCTAVYNLANFAALSSPQKATASWYVTVNGVTSYFGFIDNLTDLTESLNALDRGTYTLNSNTITGVGSFTYGNIVLYLEDIFNQTFTTTPSCVASTPVAETYCYDTIICETETLPCGCPVLNDEVVNTIQSWGTLFNEFIQRDLHGLDWQQTFKQPLSWFGYFNINAELGLIQFDPHYPFDTVYIQYYSANEVTGGDYLVPVFAKEALAAYIIHKFTWTKKGYSAYDRKQFQKAYYNEKKKVHSRMNPARFAQIMSVTRMNPRP